MAQITVTQMVQATPAEVWKSWDDFGNVARFHPALSGSRLLADQDTGLGATRQCDLKNGKDHIRERIVGYVPNERMIVEIYDGTMPVKWAKATITLKPVGASQTQVRMEMEFTPKYGPLGALMVPLMKGQFRKLLEALLEQNAKHVEAQAA